MISYWNNRNLTVPIRNFQVNLLFVAIILNQSQITNFVVTKRLFWCVFWNLHKKLTLEIKFHQKIFTESTKTCTTKIRIFSTYYFLKNRSPRFRRKLIFWKFRIRGSLFFENFLPRFAREVIFRTFRTRGKLFLENFGPHI